MPVIKKNQSLRPKKKKVLSLLLNSSQCQTKWPKIEQNTMERMIAKEKERLEVCKKALESKELDFSKPK